MNLDIPRYLKLVIVGSKLHRTLITTGDILAYLEGLKIAFNKEFEPKEYF